VFWSFAHLLSLLRSAQTTVIVMMYDNSPMRASSQNVVACSDGKSHCAIAYAQRKPQ